MISDYPPHVPSTMPQIDRAIALLGEAAKHALKRKVATELRGLIGAAPDPATAAKWKTHLKALRADLVAEDNAQKAG